MLPGFFLYFFRLYIFMDKMYNQHRDNAKHFKEGNTMARKKKFRIPGLTFSWKRFFGITRLKQRIARKTGIPTTKQGRKNKLRRMLLPFI